MNGTDASLTKNARTGQETNRRTYNHNRRTNIAGFKGETEKMNGNVFQLHSDRKKSQFTDTMEALRVYLSTAYKSDIKYLNSLFTELKEPSVDVPADPVTIKSIDEDGKVVNTTSRFEEMKYTESVKQWIRDDKSLKSTMRSQYNIVSG